MDYQKIYTSQIFEQSQCIWHENAFVDLIRSILTFLGYEPIDERKFLWQKDIRRVYIAIVDDLEHLNYENHPDFLDSLTKDSLVITDNWFNRPLSAEVSTLPNSWFGIYAGRPYIENWVPEKSWSMPVNRIDYNRMMVFLEMHSKGYIDDDCLVNFNCARHTDNKNTIDQQDLWISNWNNLTTFYQQRYLRSFETLTPLIPFKNHDLDLDKVVEMGNLQIVLETYVSDHSVALSEKIFRALVTPRPWRVLGGTWTVSRLKSLGFDVLDDIVDHDTDGLKMIEDKISKFVESCHESWTNLSWKDIEHSCQRARDHNQDLLENLRRSWPHDLSRWLPDLVDRLA